MSSFGSRLVEKYGLREKVGDTETMKAQLSDALVIYRMSQSDGMPIEVPNIVSEESLGRLYIGGVGCIYSPENMHTCGITHIISLEQKSKSPTRTSSSSTTTPAAYTQLRCNVYDSINEKISRYFNICFSFIDIALTNGNHILIQCFQGISRAATLCIAYMMLTRHRKGEEVNVEKCLDILRSVRPTVRPNPGFMLELMSLQRFLNTRLSLTIQDSAVTTTHSSDGNLP
jgi:protein-tyrosine phosphatase